MLWPWQNQTKLKNIKRNSPWKFATLFFPLFVVENVNYCITPGPFGITYPPSNLVHKIWKPCFWPTSWKKLICHPTCSGCKSWSWLNLTWCPWPSSFTSKSYPKQAYFLKRTNWVVKKKTKATLHCWQNKMLYSVKLPPLFLQDYKTE